jgi:hypothetical protein
VEGQILTKRRMVLEGGKFNSCWWLKKRINSNSERIALVVDGRGLKGSNRSER